MPAALTTTPATTPRGSEARSRLKSGRPAAEAMLVLGLLVFAAFVRFPELWNLPRFTDETDDMLFGLGIAQGRIRPLTYATSYISALFDYLLAVLWWWLGPSVYWPRLLVYLFGVLTVGATYLLGRTFGGRLAGAVAAALLASNVIHSVVDSHVAWANCLTPGFSTLGAWALYRAAGWPGRGPAGSNTARGGWHTPSGLLAGLMFGLALQTHPSAALLLPGAAGFVLLALPRAVRRRGPWLALAAFLVGYSPMILANLLSGFNSIRDASEVQQLYAGSGKSSFGGYPDNLGAELLAFPAMLGGAPVDQDDRLVVIPLGAPMLVGGAVAIVGLALAAWRGNWLPPLLVLPYLAALPLLTERVERLVDGRYLAPLFPLCFAAFGLAVAAVWRWLGARAQTDPRPERWRWCQGVVLGGLVLLVLTPLGALIGYYRVARSTNAPILAALETVQRELLPDERVVLDDGLARANAVGDGRLSRIFRAVLGSAGVPFVAVEVTPERLSEALGGRSSDLAIVEAAQLKRLRDDFQIDQLALASEANPAVSFDFATVRLTPRRPIPPPERPSGAIVTDPVGAEVDSLSASRRRPSGGQPSRPPR
jgi:hypothetical protein